MQTIPISGGQALPIQRRNSMSHTKEREELRNEISRIRYDVVKDGSTIITPERYDVLQKEWILRCCDEIQQQRIEELQRQLDEKSVIISNLNKSFDVACAEIKELQRELDEAAQTRYDLQERLGAANDKLETERIRLAACGVVALSNTPESAEKARQMQGIYWSASCEDVARMVDKNMELQRQNAELVECMEEMDRRFKLNDWTNQTLKYLDKFRALLSLAKAGGRYERN